jgi:hypothetical protein
MWTLTPSPATLQSDEAVHQNIAAIASSRDVHSTSYVWQQLKTSPEEKAICVPIHLGKGSFEKTRDCAFNNHAGILKSGQRPFLWTFEELLL